MPDDQQMIAVTEPVSGSRLHLKQALEDIATGFAKHRVWSALAWQEFSQTYRRSLIGVMWVTLSFAAFVFIKILIFSSLLITEIPGYYDSYLVTGFFVWFYLSQSITASPDTFISNAGWIRSEPLPFSVYVYKMILREAYSLAFTAVVLIGALIYIGYQVNLIALPLSMLAIPFYFLSAASLKLLLGTITVRIRDLSHLTKAIMLPMMFLTPIFWMPSQMESLMTYLWWNPLYHYIEIFRAPILDGEIPVMSWVFVLCIYVGISVAALLMFARFRRRIVFWL
ncbi:MAG: ABC transporter permease [Hyphomonas sp.]|nr:ABC transporter permease [Hyphomonas sp.]